MGVVKALTEQLVPKRQTVEAILMTANLCIVFDVCLYSAFFHTIFAHHSKNQEQTKPRCVLGVV